MDKKNKIQNFIQNSKLDRIDPDLESTGGYIRVCKISASIVEVEIFF